MISKRDVQLGKIALAEDMVSKEQINKCLKIKKKLKTKASLGAILVKKGYIDKDQLEVIVGIHNNRTNGKNDDTKSRRKSAKQDPEKDEKRKQNGQKSSCEEQCNIYARRLECKNTKSNKQGRRRSNRKIHFR